MRGSKILSPREWRALHALVAFAEAHSDDVFTFEFNHVPKAAATLRATSAWTAKTSSNVPS